MLPVGRKRASVPEKQQRRRTLHVTPHPPSARAGLPERTGGWKVGGDEGSLNFH